MLPLTSSSGRWNWKYRPHWAYEMGVPSNTRVDQSPGATARPHRARRPPATDRPAPLPASIITRRHSAKRCDRIYISISRWIGVFPPMGAHGYAPSASALRIRDGECVSNPSSRSSVMDTSSTLPYPLMTVGCVGRFRLNGVFGSRPGGAAVRVRDSTGAPD